MRRREEYSMKIAIIGTRNPSTEMASLCHKICTSFRDMGWELVTGNADGIDSIARDVWNEQFPERVTLVLPWPSYNRNRAHKKNRIVVYRNQRGWAESVIKHHPRGAWLKPGAFKLHARNYGIVEMSDIVVAFPNDGREGGGTGQGIRVARALGRELFVMPGNINKLRDFYKSI
jgi:hypothetical protein